MCSPWGQMYFRKRRTAVWSDNLIVKGDVRKLDGDAQALFTQLEEFRFGFTGLTEQISEVRRLLLGCRDGAGNARGYYAGVCERGEVRCCFASSRARETCWWR